MCVTYALVFVWLFSVCWLHSLVYIHLYSMVLFILCVCVYPVRSGTCYLLPASVSTQNRAKSLVCLLFFYLVFLLIVVKVPTVSPGVAAHTLYSSLLLFTAVFRAAIEWEHYQKACWKRRQKQLRGIIYSGWLNVLGQFVPGCFLLIIEIRKTEWHVGALTCSWEAPYCTWRVLHYVISCMS